VNILNSTSLKQYNTFGLEASAKYLVEVSSLTQLIAVLKSDTAIENKVKFIGGGSNLLICNQIDALVIINKIVGVNLHSETEDKIQVTAMSGTLWHNLVLQMVEIGYGGIENLSLIPGSVGAAPMQNIGAYGVELKDVFVSLSALNLKTLQLEVFNLQDCEFGYRESVFKNKLKDHYFIYDVTLELSKNPITNTNYGDISATLMSNGIELNDANIKDVSNAVIEIRSSKLPNPKILGNSGSFFKNPVISTTHFEFLLSKFKDIKGFQTPHGVKVPAGWLIESLGWKGKKIGNTGSHAKQALVLVNYGGAIGSEIKSLAEDIIQSVWNSYQIKLETEVNIWEN